MNFISEILLFAFVGFLYLIERADGFPLQFPEDYLKVVIGRRASLSARIRNRNEVDGPRVPEWMTEKTTYNKNYYLAYIRTMSDHFSTIIYFKLDAGQYPTNQVPTEAFLRFKGKERFEATGFEMYFINKPHTDSQFGKYGRVYVSYPNGLIFSALLNPIQEEIYSPEPPRARSVSPKRPTGCCSFFPGGKK